jgi:hypothetical protein
MQATGAGHQRPPAILWAVAITVVVNIASAVLFVLPLPGNEDIPTGAVIFGVALSAVTVVLCYWLWQEKKWAAIAITIITLLNMLTGIPALLDPPSGTLVAIILAGVPLTLIPIWLMWHPTARRAYH